MNGATVFALFFGPAAPFDTLILGTLCATRAEAETLLRNSKAKGYAFPGERVRELSVEQYNHHVRRHGLPEVDA